MRKWYSSLAIAACLALGASTMVMMMPAEAVAQKKKSATSKAEISAVLGDLTWGMSHDMVMKKLEEKIMADFQAKSRGTTDLAYADMQMKARVERIENMKKSYLPLVRDNVAGLSVSIIGEEFMPDNDESILTQREDIATKYYFFLSDKLYKIAIVYDSSYLGPIAFDTFVATTEQKYGPSSDEVWTDDGDFNESIWRAKDGTTLSVKNKYASYNTFLMVFSEEAVNKTLVHKHIAHYKMTNAGPEISSSIDSLTSDSAETSGPNSVDELLGKKTEVNLLAGLTQEDIDIIEGRVTAEQLEKQKKAKAKRGGKNKKTNAKAKQGLEIF